MWSAFKSPLKSYFWKTIKGFKNMWFNRLTIVLSIIRKTKIPNVTKMWLPYVNQKLQPSPENSVPFFSPIN